LVFGSASAEGISLDEHLGSAKEFIDLILNRSPVGEVELSSGVQKMRYAGNWKMLPENSLEGAYHGHFIHKFTFDLADSRTGRDRMAEHNDAVRYLPGGHMVEDFRGANFPARKNSSPAEKAYLDSLVSTYGEEYSQQLLGGRAPILFLFPNLMYVQTHFRRLQPVSINETHVYYQPAFLKGVPPEINERLLRAHESSFGPAGFLSPDDFEILERSQVGVEAHVNEWLFIGRGVHREKPLPDGGSLGAAMDENHLRGMWRHYLHLMNGASS
jgi:fatty-acyl-CoA synthase